MLKDNSKIIFRILNLWFSFIVLLIVGYHLPHWSNFTIHGWINTGFYFLLFLLAFSIYLKEKNNRDIFFNLSLYLFTIAITIVIVFIGEDYLFGNNWLMYFTFQYERIAVRFFFAVSIIYIVIKYLFSNTKLLIRYLITLLIVLPIIIYNFAPYIINSKFITTPGVNHVVFFSKRLLNVELLSLFFILLYGYLLFKNDKLLGRYINTLMAFYLIVVLTNIVGFLSNIYNFTIFSLHQYVLTVNLTILSFILFKKLAFINSEFGQIYESMIQTKLKIGRIKIQRHRGAANAAVLKLLGQYIVYRRNYLLSLVVLTILGIGYFKLPAFFTINLIALVGVGTIIFLFTSALYKKRAANKFTI